MRGLVPDLPDVLEAELVGVDPDEAPYREDEDPEHVEAEHLSQRQNGALQACYGGSTYRFRRNLETLLNEPEQAFGWVSVLRGSRARAEGTSTLR